MRSFSVILLGLLLVCVGRPAAAERQVSYDGRGDVWASESEGSWSATGWAPNVDVRRTLLDHGRDSVFFRAAYVNLRDWVSEEIQLNVEMRTDESSYEAVIFIFWDGHSAGGYLADADGLPFRCRGMRTGTSFERNIVRLSIPRVCLGNPRWVRHREYASSYDAEFTHYYRDVVPGSGHELGAWSPRIRRG